MSAIIIPSRWTRQPTGPVEIDWNHPSSRQLVVAIRPDFALDVANNARLTVTGTKIRPIAACEQARGFGTTFGVATTDILSYTKPTKFTNSGPQSWLFDYMVASAGGGSFGTLSRRNTSGGGSVYAIRTGTSNSISLSRSITGTDVGNSDWTGGAYNKSHRLVICNDGVTAANSVAFEDGVKLTRNGTTTSLSGGTAASTDLLYSGNAPTVNRNLDGMLSLTLMWTRFLSDAEALELTRNPWQIFKPLVRRIYFDVPAGTFQAAWARNRNTLIGAGISL